MNERTRKDLLSEKEKLSDNLLRKEQILKEIDELVVELKQLQIISDLKTLGDVYKDNLELQKQIEKRIQKKISKSRDACTHPILYRIGYQKHIDNSARLYKAEKEDALHCKVRCLECGKYTYTKNNDGSEDWDNYILVPDSLIQLGEDYVKRIIVDSSYNIKFKDLFDYYQEIVLDYPQKEVVKMIKQKIKEKK